MFDERIGDLDTDATLAYLTATRAARAAAEANILAAAAHFGDLHAVTENDPDGTGTGRVLPGVEELVQLGGDGTPEVAEFAPAEAGPELGTSTFTATRLIADALDLRHRLPTFWARIGAGEVSVRAGRMVAVATRHLSQAAAAEVDAAVAPVADSLSWAKLDRFLTAEVIAADPDLAHQRAQEAAETQEVRVLPSNDSGIKTAIIRTQAANLVWFDARIDQIADTLATRGDTRTKDIRRAEAVGVIANPHAVLDLLDTPAPDRTDQADSNEQDEQPEAADPADEETGPADEEETGPVGPSGHPRRVTRCVCACHTDPALSRSKATLYVHLHEDAIRGGTHQVARLEGTGPITMDQARELLGHCQVTINPVIDLAHQASTDSYEVPPRLREAVRLVMPSDMFPYASSTTRKGDLDHTIPWKPPNDSDPPGDPPPDQGQTRIGNLAPLNRHHHRIKTHGRWQVKQPFPGIIIWRSPHNRYYLIDHTGTHRLGTT
ncbi:MAG: DUF222 domain-containing protein [Nocardioidaceae bacterium]